MKRKVEILAVKLAEKTPEKLADYVLILAFIICILIFFISYRCMPIYEFTEKEINDYAKIAEQIIANDMKDIDEKIKENADINNYEITVNYLEHNIVFSFNEDEMGEIVFDYSNSDKIVESKCDYKNAKGNNLFKAMLIAFFSFILLIPILGGSIILFVRKIVYGKENYQDLKVKKE